MRGAADAHGTKFAAAHRALAAGDYVFAQALFTELIDSARLPAKELSRLYDARGVAYYRLGLNLLAYEDFGRAITLDSGNPTAHNNRGTLFFGTADYHSALAEFDAALKIKPGYAVAWEGRGLVLDIMGRREDARQSFRKAHDLGRRSSAVLDGLK